MHKINDKTKEIIEETFIDYFQMTIDQFDNLDLDTQEELIKKALILRKKTKYLEEKTNTRHRLSKIFAKKKNKK